MMRDAVVIISRYFLFAIIGSFFTLIIGSIFSIYFLIPYSYFIFIISISLGVSTSAIMCVISMFSKVEEFWNLPVSWIVILNVFMFGSFRALDERMMVYFYILSIIFGISFSMIALRFKYYLRVMPFFGICILILFYYILPDNISETEIASGFVLGAFMTINISQKMRTNNKAQETIS